MRPLKWEMRVSFIDSGSKNSVELLSFMVARGSAFEAPREGDLLMLNTDFLKAFGDDIAVGSVDVSSKRFEVVQTSSFFSVYEHDGVQVPVVEIGVFVVEWSGE
jgi:hypothetical protein